jgi:hypothetical protein
MNWYDYTRGYDDGMEDNRTATNSNNVLFTLLQFAFSVLILLFQIVWFILKGFAGLLWRLVKLFAGRNL